MSAPLRSGLSQARCTRSTVRAIYGQSAMFARGLKGPVITRPSVARRQAQTPFQLLQRKNLSTAGPQEIFNTKTLMWTMMGLNAIVFGAWSYASATRDGRLFALLTKHTTLSWVNLNAGRYHTLITSAFSHQNLTHFLFNMIGLWTFGLIIGSAGVAAVPTTGLLLGSALCGSTAWLFQQRGRYRNGSALGASGMVMGAAVASTLLRPYAPMALMGIIPLPLWAATALFVGMDLYYLDKASKVGHSAHLGGAAFGALFYALNLRRGRGVPRLR